MKAFKAVLLAGLLLVGAGKGWGQDSLGISRAGRQGNAFWSPPGKLSINDNLAMTATWTSGVKILRFEDNGQLTPMNTLNVLNAVSTAVTDSLLFINDQWGSIRAYTLSVEPELLSEIIEENPQSSDIPPAPLLSYDHCLLQIERFQQGDSAVMEMFDFSDPRNLRLMGSLQLDDASPSWEYKPVYFDSSLAIVLSPQDKILFYDISDPADIGLITSYQTQRTPETAIKVDHYLYYTTMSGLYTLDVQDQANPEPTGELVRAVCGDFAYSNERLFVFERSDYSFYEMRVLDIENPNQPEVIGRGFYEMGSGSWIDNASVTIRGDFAFLTTEFGIVSVNIRNPQDLDHISSYLEPVRRIYGVQVRQNKVYALELRYVGTEGFLDLTIYGLNEQRLPVEIGSVHALRPLFEASSTQIAFRDTICFVLGNCDEDAINELVVINVADSTRPALIRYAPNEDGLIEAERIAVGDRYLFLQQVVRNDYKISIIEPIRPDSLVVRSVINLPGRAHGLGLIGNAPLTMIEGGTFIVYSIDDLNNPIELSSININDAHYFLLDGTTCRIFRDNGVTTIDYEDPVNPQIIAESAGRIWAAEMQGDELICFSDTDLRLWTFRDPENPVLQGSFTTSPYSIGKSELLYPKRNLNNRIYVANRCYMDVFDCSAAMGEAVAPVFRNPPGAQSVNENDTLAFALTAVDLNGDSLTLTALDLPEGSVFDDQGGGQGMFQWTPNFDQAGEYSPRFIISDGELTDTCTVRISVRNVNRPPALTHLISPPDGYEWRGTDTLRFYWTAASDSDGEDLAYHIRFLVGEKFEIFSAGLDTNRLVSTYDLTWLLDDYTDNELTWSVWTLDGMDSTRSEEVFRFVHYSGVGDSSFTPSFFRLDPCYPNPFNSTTTISFSLSAQSASSAVNISVYGLDGKLVEELVNGKLQAGEHKVVWKASSLTAGVYLIRLDSSTHTATQKVVLMK